MTNRKVLFSGASFPGFPLSYIMVQGSSGCSVVILRMHVRVAHPKPIQESFRASLWQPCSLQEVQCFLFLTLSTGTDRPPREKQQISTT